MFPVPLVTNPSPTPLFLAAIDLFSDPVFAFFRKPHKGNGTVGDLWVWLLSQGSVHSWPFCFYMERNWGSEGAKQRGAEGAELRAQAPTATEHLSPSATLQPKAILLTSWSLQAPVWEGTWSQDLQPAEKHMLYSSNRSFWLGNKE